MGSRGFNFSLVVNIVLILLMGVLFFGPYFGFILFSPDSTENVEIIRYNLDSQNVDHQYFNLTTPRILTSSYYENNGSAYMSYLTTEWEELNQNDYDINISLVNREMSTGKTDHYLVYSGIVDNAGDRFAYLGMQLLVSNNVTTPIFATVFTQNSNYYYQYLSDNGTILESTRILQGVTGYFHYDSFNQKSDTILSFKAGKVLSDNSHATNRHIVEYNMSSNSISNEIELEHEISTYILSGSGIIAMYTDSAGDWDNMGRFNETGKLERSYGVIEGRVLQQIDTSHLLMIRNLGSINIQKYINWGYIGVFVIMVVLILYQTRLNKKSDKSKSESRSNYLN